MNNPVYYKCSLEYIQHLIKSKYYTGIIMHCLRNGDNKERLYMFNKNGDVF